MAKHPSLLSQITSSRELKKQRTVERKLEKLQQNVKYYEKIFQEDSSCRNLRNYNKAIVALKAFEKEQNLDT